jgi:predicted nucleotidyltransferase
LSGSESSGNENCRLAKIIVSAGILLGMDFGRSLQTVTPTLDGDVLAVLARAETEMSGRELQRMAGRGSHQGIRNAAERLVQQGIVSRRPIGGAYLYSLNRQHLAAPWVEGLADLAGQLVARLRAAVAPWELPPALVVLFGSVAAGHATADSDIDLLVIRPAGCDPDAPQWRSQLGELEELATALTGNDARIVELGEDELGRVGEEPVVREALREGIELYGQRSTLRVSAGVAQGAR